MKKFLVIFLIVFLIFFNALIKNSTKRIDDQIFATKENIRSLKKDFDNINLEHNYLSSSEKLLEFQSLYFDNELAQKNLNDIKLIIKKEDQILIKDLDLDK